MSSENDKAAAQKLREVAQKWDKVAVEAAKDNQTSMWEKTRACYEIHEKELFRHLGFEIFDAWRVDRKMGSHGGIYGKVRIFGELLKFLTFAEIKKLTQENADLLRQVPAKYRTPRVIEQAQTLNEEQFAKIVNKWIQTTTPAGEEAKELSVILKYPMALSQKEFVEGALRQFAEDRHLEKENPSKVLELFAAEYLSGRAVRDQSDAERLVTFLVPDLKALVDLTADKDHDPQWRVDQTRIKLERVLTMVLKPETVLQRKASA